MTALAGYSISRQQHQGVVMCRVGYKQTPEHVAARMRYGKNNHGWLGDEVSAKGGRTRAIRAFPEIGPCEMCGAARAERHHRDGNTANNAPSNIAPLCRKCHMAKDGRLEEFSKMAKTRVADAISASAAKRRSRTHCKNGHPLAGANLYTHNNKRSCKTCQRASAKAYRERLKNAS